MILLWEGGHICFACNLQSSQNKWHISQKASTKGTGRAYFKRKFFSNWQMVFCDRLYSLPRKPSPKINLLFQNSFQWNLLERLKIYIYNLSTLPRTRTKNEAWWSLRQSISTFGTIVKKCKMWWFEVRGFWHCLQFHGMAWI